MLQESKKNLKVATPEEKIRSFVKSEEYLNKLGEFREVMESYKCISSFRGCRRSIKHTEEAYGLKSKAHKCLICPDQPGS